MNRTKAKHTIRRAAHARGAAMMMVLSVVAAGSILSWAMLSSSAMRSAVEVNATDSIDAGYLAESGVSYAMYYLRYPAKSPVALTAGPYNAHYGGQAGVRLWSDARGLVDIQVTNTASYCYTIKATAIVQGMRRVIEADVKQTTIGYQVVSAAAFNGPFSLPNTMTINGPVISSGAVDNQGSRISNSPPISPTGSAVMPVLSDNLLHEETGTVYAGGLSTDRTYTHNGKTYAAERLPSSVTLTLATARPTLNPMNVWYSDSGVTFNGVTMTGTIVMRNSAPLTLTGTNRITASSGMPALLAAKQVELKHGLLTSAKLTVDGVVWIGERIIGSTYTKNDGNVVINGALLMGGTSGFTPTIGLTGTSSTSVTYNAANVSKVDNLSKTRTINGVNVLAWRQVE